MKQPKYIFLIILVYLLATFVCVGQQGASSRSPKNTGKIQGLLFDVTDARIVGATIIIENAQFKQELKSSEEGDFEIELPAGIYQIKAEAHGFRRFELSPFKVKANVTEMINIHMEVMVFTDPY